MNSSNVVYQIREEELLAHIKKLTDDVQESERIVGLLREKFKEFESKLKFLVEENEELKKLLKEKHDELTKSQEILPSVSEENKRLKEALSKKEQEIDKLSQQAPAYEKTIDSLKRRINDLEDERLKNLQKNSSLETKVLQQGQEINRLNDIVTYKTQEADNWRKKCEELEKGTQAFVDNTLKEVEAQFKARLDKEREEYIQKAKRDEQETEAQIQRLKKKTEDDEDKITLLITENERLNSMINDKNQEIRVLRDRLTQAEYDRQADVERARAETENRNKAAFQAEVQELNNRFNTLTNKYEQELKKYKDKAMDLEVRQILYFIEIERLYVVQAELIEEVNYFNNAYAKLVQEHEQAKAKLGNTAKFEEILRNFQDKVNDLEVRNNHLVAENARLSDLSIQRLHEIDNLKRNATNSVLPTTDDTNRPSQADLQEMILNFESEKRQWDQERMTLKHTIEATRAENLRLKDLNEQRKQEYEELKKWSESVNTNSARAADLERQLQLLRDQYEQAKKELEQMRRNRDFYKEELQKVSQNNLEAIHDIVRDSVKYGDYGLRSSGGLFDSGSKATSARKNYNY